VSRAGGEAKGEAKQGVWARLGAWLHGHVPTREQLEANRWLRPVAHLILRPELWRFTRRSVPRGVALGLFVGVMIPLAHFVVACFLAVFLRANIPAAMLATFVGFPVIYVGLVAIAYKIGGFLLNVDALTKVQPITNAMETTQTDKLLEMLSHKGLAVGLGLLIIASVLAMVGYVGTSFGWRWWIGRKLRLRRARHQAA
jgi:uncharacterized protein (DUF2062 family)